MLDKIIQILRDIFDDPHKREIYAAARAKRKIEEARRKRQWETKQFGNKRLSSGVWINSSGHHGLILEYHPTTGKEVLNTSPELWDKYEKGETDTEQPKSQHIEIPPWFDEILRNKSIDTFQLANLEEFTKSFQDPLSQTELSTLIEAFTIYRLTLIAQESSYDNTDLDTLVRLGRVDEAIRIAEHRNDIYKTASSFVAIGKSLCQEEILTDDFLDIIQQKVKKVIGTFRGEYTVRELIKLCVEYGDLQRPYRIIMSPIIIAGIKQEEMWKAFARALADNGLFTKADGIVNSNVFQHERKDIRDYFLKALIRQTFDLEQREISNLLREVAHYLNLTPKGNLTVVDLIHLLERDFDRITAFLEYAEALRLKGNLVQSQTMVDEAQGIMDDRKSNWLQPKLAIIRRYLLMSDLDSALQAFDEIENARRFGSSNRVDYYILMVGELAYALEQNGRSNESEKYMNLVRASASHDKHETLTELALQIAKKDDLETAEKIVSYIASEEKRGKAYGQLANYYCRVGNFDLGIELFNRSRSLKGFAADLFKTCKAMIAVANALVYADKKHKAENILRFVYWMRDQLDKGYQVEKISDELVLNFVSVGQLDIAFQLVEEVKNEQLGRRCHYVRALAEFGYGDLAQEQIDIVEEQLTSNPFGMEFYSDSLMIIANGLVRTRRYDWAWSCYHSEVASIELASEFKDQEKAEIATLFLNANNLDEAIKLTKTIKHVYERCRSYRLLVKELVDQDRLEDAKHVLSLIQVEPDRGSYQETRALAILAKALYDNGQVSEAISYLQKAEEVAIAGQDIRGVTYVASGFAHIKDRPHAREVYQIIDQLIHDHIKRRGRNVHGLDRLYEKYVTSLIESDDFELASHKISELLDHAGFETFYHSTRRELRNGYIKREQFASAFEFYDVRFDVRGATGGFLTDLAWWTPKDDVQKAIVWTDALEKAVEIVGWIQSDWQRVAEILADN